MARGFRELTIVGGLLASCLAASAQDGNSPASVPTPAFSGPWIGVYGGYGWGRPSGTWTLTGGGLDAYPVVENALNAAGSNAIGSGGGVFGLQGGWNWRVPSNFVLGVEADVGRYGLSGSAATGGLIPLFPGPVTFTTNQSYNVDWEAALRLRAGYAFNDFAMVFVDAGPAIANIRYSSAFWNNAGSVGYAFDETENVSLRSLKAGISLGAGVEFAVTRNLSVRADYQYTRFPSLSGSASALLDPPFGTATVAHTSGALNQNAFRIGANYYFK